MYRNSSILFALIFTISSFVFAYLPGENHFITQPNSHGIFGNPALVPAFDSPGALFVYEREAKDVNRFRAGGNFYSLGFGFDYLMSESSVLDEARWNLTYGVPLFDRAFFVGSRAELFRSADFDGNAFSFSPGVLWRPAFWLALGYSGSYLVQVGAGSQERVHEFGATVRPLRGLSLSWNSENMDSHLLLLSADLLGFEVGVQIPVYGKEEEYRLTLSRSIGPYFQGSLFFNEDHYYPRGGAVGYHYARNPYAIPYAQVVRVPLSRPIREEASGFSLFGNSDMSLEMLRNHFEHLKTDPSSAVVIFDFSGFRSGTAAAKEIQRGIAELRATGRRVIAYMDEVKPVTLFASSSADRVVFSPSARVNFRGLGSEALYYKGLLDWIGVEVEFLRHGAYKSAVEPYTLDSMSKEARENRESLYSDWWKVLTEDVYKRSPRKAALDSFVERPELTAASAVRAGLGDAVLYLDELAPYALKTFYGIDQPLALSKTWAPREVKIFDEDTRTRGKIALLNIEGTIVDGEGGVDLFSGTRSTGSAEILRALDIFMRPHSYDALIVRINSPGGSALASDVIWHRLRTIASKTELPIIASIGDVGASGGFYIACGADVIIAENASIVGSIGVFGGKVNLSSLLSKLKINAETVKTHPSADSEGLARSLTEAEKQSLQAYMDDFYERFVRVVSGAIQVPAVTVDSTLGGGRVFIGKKAKELGLIHDIGGMDKALSEAKRRAGIAVGKPVEVKSVLSEDFFIHQQNDPIQSISNWVKAVEKVQVWSLDPRFISNGED
ncbi:MAG: S49 family peptidase [Fibrobacter sp.]|jgi:protease-4|nr:S49 family peptidase [Fibrobacter sp.]